MSDRIIAHILEVEGWPKYTNAPADRGGPTKGGITLATLSAWRGRPCSIADLQNLQQPEAESIYRQVFIVGPRFDRIVDELLRFQVVDCGVHSGPRRAVEWLQFVVEAKVDGVLGPVTLAAVNGADPHRLALRLAAARVRFLARLIERDRTQAKWANGWMSRAMRFVEMESWRAA